MEGGGCSSFWPLPRRRRRDEERIGRVTNDGALPAFALDGEGGGWKGERCAAAV